MNAYKLNSYHALPTKNGFLVVGCSSIELQSRRTFSVEGWHPCPIQDFIEAYQELTEMMGKEFFGGICTALAEIETLELE